MKLANLRIKNFRAIGSGNDGSGLYIDLEKNNIVFIFGKNNVGKSAILKAYELFVGKRKVEKSDFFTLDSSSEVKEDIEIEMLLKADTEEELSQTDLFGEEKELRLKKIWSFEPDETFDDETFEKQIKQQVNILVVLRCNGQSASERL